MKTIQLKIDDSRLETFLTIIHSLKIGMVRDIIINDTDAISVSKDSTIPWIKEVSDEENAYYVNVLKNMNDEDKNISSKERVTLWT